MATRVFSDEELEGLRSFPAIGKDELIRYFTLTPADEAFLRKFLRPQTVLGAAVQLCTLPWLGFVPDEVPSAPPAAVGRLARQLGLPVEVLRGYGVSRGQTRTDHLRQVAGYLGWRAAKVLELEELDEFLLARAMEHDSPSLLFRLGCEYLRSAKVIRPGVVSLLERVATARRAAERETHARVAHLLDAGRVPGLEGLLVVEPELKSSRLHWLVTGPVQASPNSVGGEVEKLKFLRGLGADTLDLSGLPAERRRHLAQIGRRLTAQALVRREPNRRHPILLTLLAQSAVDVLDCVVQLFDQTLSGSESRARFKLRDALAERARLSEDRLTLLDEILPVLADTGIPDEDVGTLLREKIGMDRIRTAHAGAAVRLPRDHGHLRLLEGSYTYIRQFAPKVLEAVRFAGGTEAKPLIEALEILRELNATGTRNVPHGAPTLFVPARWQGYLDEAAAKGDATAYRHYWELCTLLALRDGLRSGDVYVPGSRRYDNPAAYLFTPAQWESHRTEFCRLVGKSPDASQALPLVMDELDDALADLESTLRKGDGPVRLGDDGELVISPLSAEDIPSEAEDLHAELERMLPNVPIASLLVEMDRHTRFLDCFTHAGGKQTRSPQLKRNLIACLIGLSTNLGLHGMAASCGIPYDVLAWTAEWYIREETLREANICLVNYHHALPMTAMFGSGTLSSSDGQRFPTRGKSITARHLNKYFVAEGISTYTHVSDQHSTFGTRVIVATHREAHYVLDEILGNATDLPITEHATDTHGVTLVNFALFDLVGKQLSPRIRDLGKITLYRMGARNDYEERFPAAGPLLTKKANLDLVAARWDDLLRLAGSLKYGHATASLIVGKLSASSRQNALAAALKEYGAIRRTIYAAKYLSIESYRRKIARQLNKGESIHALRRRLHYAREGKVTRRRPEQQNEQAWCLTVATNTVICWHTTYLGLAVDELRRAGREVDAEVLAHISPARSSAVNYYGSITVDYDRELAQLDEHGHRPLRTGADRADPAGEAPEPR
ncbi:Tn3 family transposase [Streptomyces sp. KMM 9044]|uniref:Tn3 family transposase n=1 Tax=Streptomyces sp. KMM 9044 TaxID=2744474 RepID=UPI0021507CC7|nr:Tn3 family transposase [Streptomyces sp. KMM 9044]WAX79575.1 Tn3 family transposase [Streptomyces sp. KMM 9044]